MFASTLDPPDEDYVELRCPKFRKLLLVLWSPDPDSEAEIEAYCRACRKLHTFDASGALVETRERPS